jgi:hypothetical protein
MPVKSPTAASSVPSPTYRSHNAGAARVAAPIDEAYDYTAGSEDDRSRSPQQQQQQQYQSFQRANYVQQEFNDIPSTSMRDEQDDNEEVENSMDGQEALLDLAQLEELQIEAEKMKGLGNKHMAAQVSTRILAYAGSDEMQYQCERYLAR